MTMTMTITPFAVLLALLVVCQLVFLCKGLRTERLWKEDLIARLKSENREYHAENHKHHLFFLKTIDRQIANANRVLEKNSPKTSAPKASA